MTAKARRQTGAARSAKTRAFTALPLDSVIEGNCVQIMNRLPEKSVDLI